MRCWACRSGREQLGGDVPSRLVSPADCCACFEKENTCYRSAPLKTYRWIIPSWGQLLLLGLPACSSVVLSGARRASAPWILWMAQLLAEMELICL